MSRYASTVPDRIAPAMGAGFPRGLGSSRASDSYTTDRNWDRYDDHEARYEEYPRDWQPYNNRGASFGQSPMFPPGPLFHDAPSPRRADYARQKEFSVFDDPSPNTFGRPPSPLPLVPAKNRLGSNYNRVTYDEPVSENYGRRYDEPEPDNYGRRYDEPVSENYGRPPPLIGQEPAARREPPPRQMSERNVMMEIAQRIFGSEPPAEMFDARRPLLQQPLLGAFPLQSSVFDRHLQSFYNQPDMGSRDEAQIWSSFRDGLQHTQRRYEDEQQGFNHPRAASGPPRPLLELDQQPPFGSSLSPEELQRIEEEKTLARIRKVQEQQRQEKEAADYAFDPDDCETPKKFRAIFDSPLSLAQFDKAYENSIWDHDPKFTWDYLPGTKRGTEAKLRKTFIYNETYVPEEFKWKKWEKHVTRVWEDNYVPKVRERQAFIDAGMEPPDEAAKRERREKPSAEVALINYFDTEAGGWDDELCSLEYCGLCDAGFKSVLPSMVHYDSEKHEKRVRDSLINLFYDAGKVAREDLEKLWFNNVLRRIMKKVKWRPVNYKCTVCEDTELSSLLMAKSHFKGAAHQARVKGLPVINRKMPPEMAQQYLNKCMPCGVTFGSMREATLHIASMPHIINVRECGRNRIELPPGPSGQIPTTRSKEARTNVKIANKRMGKAANRNADARTYLGGSGANLEPLGSPAIGGWDSEHWCTTCNKRLFSAEQLRMHMQSAQHADREFQAARAVVKGKFPQHQQQVQAGGSSNRKRKIPMQQAMAMVFAGGAPPSGPMTVASLGTVKGGAVSAVPTSAATATPSLPSKKVSKNHPWIQSQPLNSTTR